LNHDARNNELKKM